MDITTLISRFDISKFAALLDLVKADFVPSGIHKMRGVLCLSLIPPKPLFPATAMSESIQFSIGDTSSGEFLQCSFAVAYAAMWLRSAREEVHSRPNPTCTSEATNGKKKKAICTHSTFPIESCFRESELYVAFAPVLGMRHL